ncbi:unnamed protein product [Hymenolepis diminuta]|uniref:Uncharacterized protein n=1 Tax=Hymenolepis diminuta TaxID=6216 RepID=A0A564Z3Z4_HYMDI|nr:unnamed protein product [Hymenolepis diminuta]
MKNKKSILLILERKSQLDGEKKRISLHYDRCHRIVAEACETRKHWCRGHYRNADISQIDRFSCPMDRCYKSYVKRGRLLNE